MKKTVKDLKVLSIWETESLQRSMYKLIRKGGVRELPDSLDELLEVGVDILLPKSPDTMNVAMQVLGGDIRKDIVTASGRTIREVMRDTQVKDHLATIYELTKDISDEEALASFRKAFDEAKEQVEKIEKRDADTAAKNNAARAVARKKHIDLKLKEIKNSIDDDELVKFEELIKEKGEDIVIQVEHEARAILGKSYDGTIPEDVDESFFYGKAIEDLYKEMLENSKDDKKSKDAPMNDSVQRGFGKNKQIDETISYIVKANRFI